MRGRGLKHLCGPRIRLAIMSPPMRGRGLKLPYTQDLGVDAGVAPHAGAWIETSVAPRAFNAAVCRPPCGGVD